MTNYTFKKPLLKPDAKKDQTAEGATHGKRRPSLRQQFIDKLWTRKGLKKIES